MKKPYIMPLHKYKTLHLIDTFWLGGAQSVVKGLFENNEENTNIHILALRPTPEMITINHPNVYIAENAKKWSFRIAIKKALSIINTHDIDVIHCHLPKSQLVGLFIKKKYKPNITLVFHEQGDIMDTTPFNWPTYIIGKKLIDTVVCCSHAVKKNLLQKTFFSARKVSVLHNYVDTSTFKEKPQKKEKNTFYIGFAGRITYRKGWRHFLKAIALLIKTNPQKKLQIHIAGTGPEQAKLKSVILKLNLQNHVYLHNFVLNMPNFYNQLDVLCMPSYKEPVGMVHIEAMSCGVAVVASNVSGLNEILKNQYNSLLFKPKNALQIQEALLQLIQNDELLGHIKTNGRATSKQYDYKHFEEKLNYIYTEIINNKTKALA